MFVVLWWDLLAAEDEIDRDKEHFWVFHLNARHQIKIAELVGLGTLTSCLVHPREVFTRAISYRAAEIIVAHNHPSGDARASSEDVAMTCKLVDAGKLLDIPVLDHVIVTSSGYQSLKAEGHLY